MDGGADESAVAGDEDLGGLVGEEGGVCHWREGIERVRVGVFGVGGERGEMRGEKFTDLPLRESDRAGRVDCERRDLMKWGGGGVLYR